MEIIRRLLFVTALLGIAVGPLSIGATHRAMASSGPSAMHATVDMGMSGDMPCCPEAETVRHGCAPSCPMALACAGLTVGHPAINLASLLDPDWDLFRFPLSSPPELASLFADPPARPPKS